MFMHNTEWPGDRVQRLRDLAAQGRSAKEIGAALGVSRNAVIGKAARIGVRLDGVKGNPVFRERKDNFWTPQREDQLRKAAALGLSANVIGDLIGVSGFNVKKKAMRIGATLSARPTNVRQYPTVEQCVEIGFDPARLPAPPRPRVRPKIESVPLRAAAAYASEPVVEPAVIVTPEPTVTHEEPMFTGGVAIWELRTVHCRYIVRGGGSGGVASFDPHEVRYCGETVSAGSWCATHRKLFCHSVYEARKMRAEADSE